MISIVCPSNNEEISKNYLLKGLKNQTSNYELILLDNTQGRFKSASEAFNVGGRKAKGNYIMFVHNDIYLGSNLCLEDLEKILNNLENLGIAGVAGKIEKKNYKRGCIISNITHGNPPVKPGLRIKNPIKAQTLDECLVIIPRAIFNKFQFDEKVCNDWHLHAVDYCLSIKSHGFNVYILPSSSIHHRSIGYYSNKYYFILEKVLKKHKKHYKYIYTTGVRVSTFFFLKVLQVRRLLKKSKLLIFKRIVKTLLFYYNKIWHYSSKIEKFLQRFFFDFESFNDLILFERLKY